MKAKIFYTQSNLYKCQLIADMLKKYVYDNISIDYICINNECTYSPLSSYLDLLKISILINRVDNFSDNNEVPVASNFFDWYYNNSSYYTGSYYECGQTNNEIEPAKIFDWLEFLSNETELLFPSVAIMNQIVILPETIINVFDKYQNELNNFPWFKNPLQFSNFEFTNFDDEGSMETSMKKTSLIIKAKFKKLCKYHMSVKGIKHPDFEELGRILNLDVRFLEIYREAIFNEKLNFNVKIMDDHVCVGKTSEMTMEIQNISENYTGKIKIAVKAPHNTLHNNISETLDFSNNDTKVQYINFKIHPEVTPYCPFLVEIKACEENFAAEPLSFFILINVV